MEGGERLPMCQTCAFWHANKDRFSGTCQYRAPVLVALRYVETRADMKDAPHLIWPVTDHDDNCGDWAPRRDDE